MCSDAALIVCAGPLNGKIYSFDSHNAFIFGRLEECHCCILNDAWVSRRHFIIEVNPPDMRIRDLGSLNGTYVNDRKIGSREKSEAMEQGQNRKSPEVDLKDGDIIKVGQTVLAVQINAEWASGPILCARCGKDVAYEFGGRKLGAYICINCRQSIQVDPALIHLHIFAKADAKAPVKEGLPVIAGFQIKRSIGAGSFGTVYLAERESDRKQVAIKVMLSRVAVDKVARRKFFKEIDLLKNLQHRHIVTISDSESAGSVFYFVMEFCPGGNVAEFMEHNGGKLKPAVALPIMVQALEGLAYAHSQGIIHRDIKPSNILLAGTPSDLVTKVADLGLAKNFEKAGFSGMTLTGAFAGTPIFMPKEQLLNYKYVKPVADVWSIGATFYNMLTGQLPREYSKGCDPLEVILRGEIIPINKRDPDIPRNLAMVLDKAIQANPDDRFQDAGEMVAALKSVSL